MSARHSILSADRQSGTSVTPGLVVGAVVGVLLAALEFVPIPDRVRLFADALIVLTVLVVMGRRR